LGDATQNMIVSILCPIAQGSQDKWPCTVASGFGGSFCKIAFPNENLKFLSKTVYKTLLAVQACLFCLPWVMQHKI
jgi:hypothetical protein